MKRFLVSFANLNLQKVILVNIIFFFIVSIFCFNILFPNFQKDFFADSGSEFSLLANSFLHGQLGIEKNNFMDCTVVNNQCFWPLGPMPAVILMPFVYLFNFLGLFFYQGYLNFFLVLAIFYCCFLLAKKHGFNENNSLWLALGFCFSSVFLGVAFDSRSWYFSHVVCVLFLFLALLEGFSLKRYWLVGIYLGLAIATRLNVVFATLFFLGTILIDQNNNNKTKIKNLISLSWPILIIGLCLGEYNYLRFGNFFDSGYSQALIGLDFQMYLRDNLGLFNLNYFVTNFYYYFLKLPEPVLAWGYLLKPPFLKVSPVGLSFFLVSPIFIYIFIKSAKGKIVKLAWLTSLPIFASVIFYFNCGYWQFGPRYMLDFLPFWFLILIYCFKDNQISNLAKTIISLSALSNFYLYLNLLLFYSK